MKLALTALRPHPHLGELGMLALVAVRLSAGRVVSLGALTAGPYQTAVTDAGVRPYAILNGLGDTVARYFDAYTAARDLLRQCPGDQTDPAQIEEWRLEDAADGICARVDYSRRLAQAYEDRKRERLAPARSDFLSALKNRTTMKPQRIKTILDNVDAGAQSKHVRADLDKLVMKGLLKVSLIGRKYTCTAAGQRFRLLGEE